MLRMVQGRFALRRHHALHRVPKTSANMNAVENQRCFPLRRSRRERGRMLAQLRIVTQITDLRPCESRCVSGETGRVLRRGVNRWLGGLSA